MKKIIILLVAVMLILCACNGQPSENETTGQTVTTADGETVTTATGQDKAVSDKQDGDKEESDSSDSAEEKTTAKVAESEISTMKELTSDDMEPEWTAETEAPDENTTKKPIAEETTIRKVPDEKPASANKTDGGYDLGDGIVLKDIHSYSGKYVEDGTDAQVNNIAAITVENTGTKNIQYAEITVTVGGEYYLFNATTLLPGTKMTVLECNKKSYSKGDITACGVSVSAEFTETPDTMEDKITVQLLDGVVNIINVSGEDINSTFRIYIKNIEDGVYFGGITYRISVDSIASGEIKQLSASHVSAENSKVVFITVAE